MRRNGVFVVLFPAGIASQGDGAAHCSIEFPRSRTHCEFEHARLFDKGIVFAGNPRGTLGQTQYTAAALFTVPTADLLS